MAASQITSLFGASVRTLRHRLGISQEALAERADLHRTYIVEIEGGARNITLKSMVRLARALEVTPAALLSATHEPSRLEKPSLSQSSADAGVDILVAERNRDDVELILAAFQQASLAYTAEVVPDGQEALNFLFRTGRHSKRKVSKPPKVIILDLNLPKLNGLEVLRRLKADPRTRTIPVVVLTSSQEECLKSYALGANSYIVKSKDVAAFTQSARMIGQYWLQTNHPPKP
jgi:CheY-like chemotaxis protein/DNA-binding XRE family transcriptional regulator